MEVEHVDPDLEKLETDPRYTKGYGTPIIKGFRKAMQIIRAANDERDLHAYRVLNFHKLNGQKSDQHVVSISNGWRLIVELIEDGRIRVVLIIKIEDYHH